MHPMAIGAIDAIRRESIIPLALFNWSIITYYQSPAQKGLTGNGHAYKL